MPRSEQSKKIREFIFSRDRWKCLKCGFTKYLTIDHIVPKAAGGQSEAGNYQTLCFRCNQAKGNMTIDFRVCKKLPPEYQPLKKDKRRPFIDFRLIR